MTQRIERVLDKLYNLKGENNFVIAEIEKNIKKAEETIATATNEEHDNELQKNNVIGKLTIFNNQKDAFLSAFSDLDDETFSELKDIDIEVNFGTMVKNIKEKAPGYCDQLNNEIKEYEGLIEKAQNLITSQNELVAELEDNKKGEEEKRNQLINLMEQSLSPDEVEREALSTSYVKKILTAFELFTEEEVVSLAKLIMFPEDGLIEYNDSYDETKAASFTLEEENEDDSENNSSEITEVTEVYKNEEVGNEIKDIIDTYDDEATTEIVMSALNEEKQQTVEEPAEDKNQDIDKYITDLGLNSKKVTKELKELLSQADYKLIEENYETLRSLYLTDEAIYHVEKNHSYLTDVDLNRKLTLLRAKGVSESKLKELLEKDESNFKLGIEEFTNIVDNIVKQDGKLGDENLYKIDVDTKTYEENKEALNAAGYDLEEKEERNYGAVIYASPYIKSDIKVLKEYLISIIKRNSKYALSVFWKNPRELMEDIDDIVEAGLENILETNPEVLEDNNIELIKRVKYCRESGHQIFVGEDKELYCDYITNYKRFQEKIGDIDNLTDIDSRKNDKISKLIGEEKVVDKLLEALNKYYENPDENTEYSKDINEQAEKLRKNVLSSLGYEDVGKHTYKVKDICVSKTKLERHLKIMLNELHNNKETYDGLEKEIFLTALLYNMRIAEDTMKKFIEDCLKQGGNK